MARPEKDQEYLEHCRRTVERRRSADVERRQWRSLMRKLTAVFALLALGSGLLMALVSVQIAIFFVLSLGMLLLYSCEAVFHPRPRNESDADIIARECAPYGQWRRTHYQNSTRVQVAQRVAAALTA